MRALAVAGAGGTSYPMKLTGLILAPLHAPNNSGAITAILRSAAKNMTPIRDRRGLGRLPDRYSVIVPPIQPFDHTDTLTVTDR